MIEFALGVFVGVVGCFVTMVVLANTLLKGD